jgi:multisubunit Na+/H+ antiporter MnhB subunit
MGMEYLVLMLLGVMLAAVLIAVETRDLLSSVIAIGAAGFALSVIFLLLGAPDLAITQVVVETIALVLLIRLIVTRRDTTGETETPRDALRTALVMLAGGVLICGVYFALAGGPGKGTIPPFGQPVLGHKAGDEVPPGASADYLAKSAEQTGAANVVMAVMLDYRAYDTLGEATIIFVAILGTYAVLRRFGRRKETKEPEQ